MEKIQVIIITHNRPDFVTESVESVLNQTYPNVELIVSDNSSNNLTQEIINKKNYKNIKYIRRKIVYGPIEHLNCALQEVTSNYFMIFHDDDVMFENMVETMYDILSKNENIVAVGANGFFTLNKKVTKEKIFKSSEKSIVLQNNIEVAGHYLIRNGIVPFPSYLYKKVVAQKLQFDSSEGGVFSDMTFIMKTATLGNILFLEQPLMNYYVHTENDHVPDFYLNNTKVISFIRRTTDSKKNGALIKAYRIKAIYMEFKQGILSGRILLLSGRYYRLLSILFKSSTFDYFPRILIISLLRIFNISTTKMKITPNTAILNSHHDCPLKID